MELVAITSFLILMEGLIFDIQKYRLDDGPGIRTTIFLKGCPLRCSWCSNPESQEFFPEILFNEDLCINGCEKCTRICPNETIRKNKSGSISIDRNSCKETCNICVNECPSDALKKVGRRITIKEALRKTKEDIPFYQASGGGITISGGEPLGQPGFTQGLLRKCKEEGIHTILDTGGYWEWSDLERVLNYTDLTLYDIKHMDPSEHKRYTGVDNKLILENAQRISHEGFPLLIRFPVVPGITDSEKNVASLIEFADEISVSEIDLLPYHRLGVSKYSQLGREYELDLEPPTKEKLNSIKELMKSNDLEVKIIH